MDDIRSELDLHSKPQTLVPLGAGRRLNLCISGDGAPTVVLAAGLAGITLDWVRVQTLVGRFARVVSFDNAGLGFSDPGPSPRGSEAIIADSDVIPPPIPR